MNTTADTQGNARITREQYNFARFVIGVVFLSNFLFLFAFSAYPAVSPSVITLYEKELSAEAMEIPNPMPGGINRLLTIGVNTAMLLSFIFGGMAIYGIGRMMLPPTFYPLSLIFSGVVMTATLLAGVCIFGAIFYARTEFEAVLFMRSFFIILFSLNYLLAIYLLSLSLICLWTGSYSSQVVWLIFPLTAVTCGLNFQGLQANQESFIYLLPILLGQAACGIFALDLFLQIRRLPLKEEKVNVG